MQIFNRLIHRVSRDGAYLKATLQAASEFDDFTVSASLCVAKLWHDLYAMQRNEQHCTDPTGTCLLPVPSES